MSPQPFAKNSISDRAFSEPARTLDKLYALQAKGAILNKRDWWFKWTAMPEVRAKWLLEIKGKLVDAAIVHVWSEWPNRSRLDRDLGSFADILGVTTITNALEKANAIERVLADVKYPMGYHEYCPFSEGVHYEELDHSQINKDEISIIMPHMLPHVNDNVEPFDASALDTDFPHVLAQHEKMRPFCQIAWYVAMTIVRDQLRDLPPDEWTREQVVQLMQDIWSWDHQEVIDRTRILILAVLRDGDCTPEGLREHLPHEIRPNVLKLLECHFVKIPPLLDTAVASIGSDLQIVVDELGLAARERGQGSVLYVPGPAPRTWMSDNCIPAELKSKFVAEIAALENVPDESKDWHPNSNDQVLNLVHPSLYCGVADKTKLLAAAAAENLNSDAATHMQAIMFAETNGFLRKAAEVDGNSYRRHAYHDSSFQWLPCEIDVAESGASARIRTYINNLHPEDHAPLYNSIENIFARFVPLFDQVLSTLVDPRSAPVYSPTPPYSLAGSRCQVIVKIQEIVLTPENPSYDGGSWHIEGTKAENIVATGLYYFGCENITESRLSFCTFAEQPMYAHNDNMGVALSYGLHEDEVLVQHMGDLTAMEDRCVVFPTTKSSHSNWRTQPSPVCARSWPSSWPTRPWIRSRRRRSCLHSSKCGPLARRDQCLKSFASRKPSRVKSKSWVVTE